MSIVERVDEQEKKIAELSALLEPKKGKEWTWKVKIPGKVRTAVMKSSDRAAALYVGPNRTADWRVAEEYGNRVLGGQNDQKAAELLGIKSFGQQTIIAAIEKEKLS